MTGLMRPEPNISLDVIPAVNVAGFWEDRNREFFELAIGDECEFARLQIWTYVRNDLQKCGVIVGEFSLMEQEGAWNRWAASQ